MATKPMQRRLPDTLVYITGSGHSGSTLLDMLLGGHDEIASLGEAHRFSLSLSKKSEPHRCCCGETILECPFWAKVVDTLVGDAGVADLPELKALMTTKPEYLDIPDSVLLFQEPEPLPRRRYDLNPTNAVLVFGSRRVWRGLASIVPSLRRHRQAVQSMLAVFRAVRRAWDVPVVVDSTKNPGRLKSLYLEGQEHFRIIRLVRDGRAVCYSRMRRQGLPMAVCAKIWTAEQRKQGLAMLTIPRRLIQTVRYEDLCRQPKTELQRLCAYLGVDYQPSMLDFRKGRHNLGGNPMRWRREEAWVKFDDRWQRELPSQDLRTFDEIAGRTNRRLGYSD